MVIRTVNKAKGSTKGGGKQTAKTQVKKPMVRTPTVKATSAARTPGVRTGGFAKKTFSSNRRDNEPRGQWVFVPEKGDRGQRKGKGKGQGKSGKAPRKALPKDFEFDGEARYTGKVVVYSKLKGFGFIEPDEKGIAPDDKVFVYWKGITSEDRFPFLTKEQEVEFSLCKIQGGLRAKQVCLPGGDPIANQDDQDAQKEFIGGQTMRYTGKLKFFDPKKGFGYVTLDESHAVDADVPKELRVETAEVNAGGRQPSQMKDLEVEFGIWKTKKGQHKVYNMTLPGGDTLAKEILEKRSTVGSKTYKGKIELLSKHGWGYISLAQGQTLPPQVRSKISAMNKATKDKGKEVKTENQLYFRRSDCQKGFRPEKDMDVTFQVYIDDKGAGACEITE